MKILFASFLLFAGSSLFGQNPNNPVFPATAAADTDLLPAVNNGHATLAVALNSTSSSVVLDTTAIAVPVALSIDNEIMACLSRIGTTYNCLRASDRTAAAPHGVNSIVHANIIDWNINQSEAEIKSVEQTLLTNYAYDTGVNLTLACTLAAGRTLLITKVWTNVPNTTLCAVRFEPGGLIRMAANASIVFSSEVTAPVNRQILDVSASGSAAYFSRNSVKSVYPQWFGAYLDSSHDDTVPIQQAIDSTAMWNGSYYQVNASVFFTSDAFTTAQLRLYSGDTTHVGARSYSGLVIEGFNQITSGITYRGPQNQNAIRMIGMHQIIRNMHILSPVNGWVSGISYDGDPNIGISTMGRLEMVDLQGNNLAGNGIQLGASHYQADQLTIEHPSITGFMKGYGVVSLDSNSLDNNIFNPSISHCWVGVAPNNSTDINIYGGSINDNDVNFLPGAGSSMIISGVRSEGSKRSFWSSVGNYTEPTVFMNYTLASDYATENNPSRPVATVVGSGTSITLSNNSVTMGDWVIISGAGAGGSTLHTRIAAMSDPLHATLDTAAIVVPVTSAPISLDPSMQQNNMVEQGGGPYMHIGGFFNISSGSGFTAAQGPQIFQGVGWTENMTNPFRTSGQALPSKAGWHGIYFQNLSSSPVPDHMAGANPPQYFPLAAEFGTANAIAVMGDGTPPSFGTVLHIQLAHTLRAGPNTLDYNNSGPVRIFSGKLALPADLTVGYPYAGVITLLWDGSTYWRDITQ